MHRNQYQGVRRRGRCAVWALLLAACMILPCGCTRREQLTLEVGGTAEDEGTSAGAAKESSAQDSGASGGTSETEAQPAGQSGSDGSASGQQEVGGETASAEAPQPICVHVCGAVKNPAVYELPAGSRVYEAVERAGGFAEDADESYVNQAQTLTDGVKLVIPTLQQTSGDEAAEGTAALAGVGIIGAGEGAGTPEAGAPDAAGAGQASAADGRININTASEAELCKIPGIGATRAAAIVAYRQEKGGFSSVEEIMQVSGIKEGTYAKIKDSIKIN